MLYLFYVLLFREDNTLRDKKHIKKSAPYIIFGVLFLLGAAVFAICIWYMNTYDLEFKELLYTLVSPLKGTGESTVALILSSSLPWVAAAAAAYITAAVIISIHASKLFRRIGAAVCAAVFVSSLIFAAYALRLPGYIEAISQKTTLYEEYYIDPDSVSITANGKPKNLIHIYLESMETTYASEAVGGAQPENNYLPNLTRMASEGISFTDKEDGSLGGFHTPNGTTWTMAALLATTSGIPFSFPIGGDGQNYMSKHEYFAKGLTTLGDILSDNGYTNTFLCGSNATFGGRRNYFTQHGDYRIFDLYTAREEGYIAKDYHDGWWGYEDMYLYEIAKDKLTELAAQDEPFNFTMLTVDTHHVDGNRCKLCEGEYSTRLENVVSCADRQVSEFVDWCMEQDFYRDSVIIVSGDHPRMDTRLVSEVDYYDRTIYNCFFNAALTPRGETSGRIFTSMDMFPTLLAAMGFLIDGERLGLGVNMFSGEPTLAEELGYDYLNGEIAKHSAYYIREFS